MTNSTKLMVGGQVLPGVFIETPSLASWPLTQLVSPPFDGSYFSFHWVASHPPHQLPGGGRGGGGGGLVAGCSTMEQVVLVYMLPVAEQ